MKAGLYEAQRIIQEKVRKIFVTAKTINNHETHFTIRYFLQHLYVWPITECRETYKKLFLRI
jgi:hypothetical protein